MKANHPVEFMAASMTLDTGNTEKIAEFRREAIRLGIIVEPPSVNRSGVEFDVRDGRILYSLAAIKGVGAQAVEHLGTARGDRPFRDLADLGQRINPRIINKRTREPHLAGASTIVARPASIHAVDRPRPCRPPPGQRDYGQTDMLSAASPRPILLPAVEPWLAAEKLQRALTRLASLSAHPLTNAGSSRRCGPDLGRSASRCGAALPPGACRTVTARQERRMRTGNRMVAVQLRPDWSYEGVLFLRGADAVPRTARAGRRWSFVAAERPEGITSARVGEPTIAHGQPRARVFSATRRRYRAWRHLVPRGRGREPSSFEEGRREAVTPAARYHHRRAPAVKGVEQVEESAPGTAAGVKTPDCIEAT
jgi:DNA polymerase-3 subunit alpha